MISRTTLIAILFLAPAAVGQDALKFDCHGDPLPPGAVARLGTVRYRSSANAMAFAPSGTVATLTADREFGLIDPATGATVKSWKPSNPPEESTGPCRDLAFSPDGKTIASAEAFTLRLQDLVTGKNSLHRAETGDRCHESYCVAFSSDGKTIATGGHSPSVVLWDSRTGKVRHKIEHLDKDRNRRGVYSLAFSPDCNWLVGADSHGGMPYHLVLWNARKGNRVNQIKLPEMIGAVAFAPDNKTVAAGCADRIFVCNIHTGETICTLPVHQTQISYLAFTPDGAHLVSGGIGRAVIWNVLTGYRKEHEYQLAGARHHSAFDLSRDGKTLAIHWGGIIRFIDVATGRSPDAPPGHEANINAITWSPDGRTIATASSDHTIRLWNARTGKTLDCFREMQMTTALAFSRDGRSLTSLSSDHVVRVRAIPGGHVVHGFAARPFRSAQQMREDEADADRRRWRGLGLADGVLMSVLSADGSSVATIAGGKSACVHWETATGQPTRSVDLQNWHWGLAFRPDGKGMLALTWPLSDIQKQKDSDARPGYLHDVSTNRALYEFQGDDPMPYLGPRFVLSPDGATLVFRERKTPHTAIWNLKTRKRIERVPREVVDLAQHAAFSPDGSILAVCENDREHGYRTHLIDMLTGQEIRCLTGAGWVGCLAFSPDNRKVVTASDTAPLVWDVIPPCSRPVTEAVWRRDLGSDVTEAYRAISTCLDAPDDTIPFLAQRVRPIPHVDTKTIRTWISNLGNPDYGIREKASEELRSLGTQPEAALRRSLEDNPPLETRRRVEQLLGYIEEEWRPTPTELRVMRGIQVLESIGSQPAQRVLDMLAAGAPDARITIAAGQALNRAKARAGVAQ